MFSTREIQIAQDTDPTHPVNQKDDEDEDEGPDRLDGEYIMPEITKPVNSYEGCFTKENMNGINTLQNVFDSQAVFRTSND